MRPIFLAIISLILIQVCIASDYDSSVERKMFDLVNKERMAQGIPALKWSDELQEAARKHTEKVADHQMLSHRFSDEAPVAGRLSAAGLHFSSSAENVASSSGSSADPAEDLHDALMGSPGHRANILSPKYTAIGIGVVHRGDTYFATQDFALTTSVYSDDQAEQRLMTAIADARSRVGLPRIEILPSNRLREAICAEAQNGVLTAQTLHVDAGFFGVSAATAADVDVVPPSLKKVVFSPTLRKMAVGACFKVTPKYPGGMYWLAFEY